MERSEPCPTESPTTTLFSLISAANKLTEMTAVGTRYRKLTTRLHKYADISISRENMVRCEGNGNLAQHISTTYPPPYSCKSNICLSRVVHVAFTSEDWIGDRETALIPIVTANQMQNAAEDQAVTTKPKAAMYQLGYAKD